MYMPSKLDRPMLSRFDPVYMIGGRVDPDADRRMERRLKLMVRYGIFRPSKPRLGRLRPGRR